MSGSKPELKGHEDLLEYFQVKDFVSKFATKPLRTTFYSYAKKLPGPYVVEKGSVKDSADTQGGLNQPESEPNLQNPIEKEIASRRLISALKDTVIENTSLRQYCMDQPPRQCEVQNLSSGILRTAFTFENPQPLDLIDFEAQKRSAEHREKRKQKKAAKRKRGDDMATSNRVKMARQ